MNFKQHIPTSVLLSGLMAMALSGCSYNSWNNHELDGFKDKDTVPSESNVKSIEYTLTDYDYKLVATNSTNKELAGSDKAAALKAVETKKCFSEEIQAKDYAPALFNDPSFQYFTLDDGSSINLTYRTSVGLPEAIGLIEKAERYAVSDEDYQAVWGSDENYTPSFAPSHTPASAIPGILSKAYPEAEEGQYVIVNYENSLVDPVFSAAGGGDEPEFKLSEIIGTAEEGNAYVINGYVSALSTNGFILTDKTGSIFVYRGNSFAENNYEDLTIGTLVVVSGDVSAYNRGLQVANGAIIEPSGTCEVTYPAPVDFTGARLDEIITRDGAATAIYGSMTGTVAISGNNINIKVEGAENAQGSAYYTIPELKEKLVDGSTVTMTGYIIAIAGKRYCSTIVTAVTPVAAAVPSRAVSVASTNENAIYYFNGSRWTTPSDCAVLSHADYQAMGQRYDNLSNESPATLLPIYLKTKYPYAAADDYKFVVYYYYASSTTYTRCDQYIYDGSEWKLNDGIVTETSQFVRTRGKWIFDPNVTITLPAGKGQEMSTLYYQACVDWVAANVPDGAKYVSSYGNNEYYCGTSAYQGNVDLRPSAARTQYAEAYQDMTDDEIVSVMKKRFAEEVMPGALGVLHSNVDVIPGVDTIFTINFSVYTGVTTAYVIRYKLVSKGKFEFIDCTWD